MIRVTRYLILSGLLANCGGQSATAPTSAGTPAQVSATIQVVANPSGAPVSGARVEYSGGVATTGADGTVTIPTGTQQRLTISADGFVSRVTGLSGSPGNGVRIDIIADRPPFSSDVYRTFVRGGIEWLNAGAAPLGLGHWTVAPKLYIKTVFDDTGDPVPAVTLGLAEEVFGSLLPTMTGDKFRATVFERGPNLLHDNEVGWITLRWYLNTCPPQFCSGGGKDEDGYRNPIDSGGAFVCLARGCSGVCDGARLRPVHVLQHELLHTLGFSHIGPVPGVFFGQGTGKPCDTVDASQAMSETEKLIGAIAHARPNGNKEPDIDPVGFVVR
jgi:hypothetical protein